MTEQQHHAPDPNDVLGGGGGAPIAKWPRGTEGTEIGGRIVEQPASYQEREYVKGNPGGGDPKRFPSGDFIYGVKVTVQTGMRDPQVEDDDGKRRIFIEGKRMKEAVTAAVRESGAKLAYGGELYVTFTGIEAGSDPANPQAPKTWKARYVAPGAVAANDALAAPAAPTQGVPGFPSTGYVAPAPAGPQKPAGMAQGIWDGLDDSAKAAVANLPPF